MPEYASETELLYSPEESSPETCPVCEQANALVLQPSAENDGVVNEKWKCRYCGNTGYRTGSWHFNGHVVDLSALRPNKLPEFDPFEGLAHKSFMLGEADDDKSSIEFVRVENRQQLCNVVYHHNLKNPGHPIELHAVAHWPTVIVFQHQYDFTECFGTLASFLSHVQATFNSTLASIGIDERAVSCTAESHGSKQISPLVLKLPMVPMMTKWGNTVYAYRINSKEEMLALRSYYDAYGLSDWPDGAEAITTFPAVVFISMTSAAYCEGTPESQHYDAIDKEQVSQACRLLRYTPKPQEGSTPA